MKKISIIMPTYNDCDTICETFDSIINQTHENWELLICDDGSTDNTKKIIENYKNKYDKKDRIRYFYQENADQLNALLHILKYVTGDFIYLLHSDDLLVNNDILNKMVNYMDKYKEYDAIIADLITIDENSKITGVQKVYNYINRDYVLPLQLLWLGRNLYVDFAFHRKESFMKYVYKNYLLWNGPFWLNLNKPNYMNVKKVNFSFFKYRIYSGNYMHSKLGQLCIINGEIRVVTNLLKYFYLPCYKLQYLIFRAFNKLNLVSFYRPIYSKKEIINKAKIIKFVLNKRFTDAEIEENIFLKSLLKFYQNSNIKRKIKINLNKNTPIYLGKDMRVFNKKILNNELDEFYINLMKEMQKGFDEIIVKDEKEKNIMLDITNFLCIYPYVKVTIKK